MHRQPAVLLYVNSPYILVSRCGLKYVYEKVLKALPAIGDDDDKDAETNEVEELSGISDYLFLGCIAIWS